jgi:CRP-like cAMP-binding protein
MDITQCSLFTSLKEEEIQNILQEIQIKETAFEKGAILTMQGEICNRLIILVGGSVVAEMSDPAGKVVKVEDIYAPSPLAILFLFGHTNRFPVQVTALENTKALVIPKQSVLRILSLNEQLLKNYLDISANYASMLTKKLHLMSFRTIRQKLSMYILDLLVNPDQLTVEMDRTQSALAEYFGVSRPSLARELRNMQDDGLIVMSKKEITIKDKAKLARLINF